MKFTKYLCRVLTIKRYVLDDGIRTLTYFYKDSITICKEIIEMDCYN